MTVELHPNVIADTAAFKRFLFGGNAYFTVVNEGIGKRFTYHVNECKANPQYDKEGDPIKYFVSVLTGPDVYTLGSLMWGLPEPMLKTIRKGISIEAPSMYMFASILQMVRLNKEIPPGIQIWHEGRCCVCGRPLTVPQSIAAGIGPECAGKAENMFDLSGLPAGE